jgi:hypothetical protein
VYNGSTMKERDTEILHVRIKKTLKARINEKIQSLRDTNPKANANAWVTSLIEKGLEQ